MTALRRFWLVPVLVTAIAPPALAQAIAPPAGPTSGLFASRRTADPTSGAPELTFTLDFGGGYDQNLEDGAAPTQVFSSQQSGYIGTGTGTLRYRKGTVRRFIASTGTGYLSHASEGVNRLAGGSATVNGAAAVGRRSSISAGAGLTYEPSYLFNAFGPLAEDVGAVPGASPLQGITEQRWLSTQAMASAYRSLTSRQRVDALYTYGHRAPLSGPGFESRAQAASIRHSWNPKPSAGMQVSYRFDNTTQSDDFGRAVTLPTHSAGVALSLRRSFSAVRRFSVTVGGGAARTQQDLTAGREAFVLPTVYGSTRFDISRDWSVTGDLRRDISVLEGLSVETFATTAFAVRADGILAQRYQVALSGSYASGAAPSGETGEGSYRTFAATAQVQYALSRCCAVFSSYSFYDHDLQDVVIVEPGIPDRYSLNSIRFGFNFWMPLFGRF